jgi:hypothetical protein
VKITNNNGDVRLRTSVAPSHPIEVDLNKGQIELTLPANSNFQIAASSRHGEVDCDFSGPGLKVVKEGETPSITGTYGKGGPLIRLSTEYNAIRVLRAGVRPPAPSSKGEDRAWNAPRHDFRPHARVRGAVCCPSATRLARWISLLCRLQGSFVEALIREGWDCGLECPRPAARPW